MKHALLRRNVEKGMNFQDKDDGLKHKGEFQKPKSEAFAKIIPKNISPRKLRIWQKTVGV